MVNNNVTFRAILKSQKSHKGVLKNQKKIKTPINKILTRKL